MSVTMIKPGKYLIQLIHKQDGHTYRKRFVFNGPERKAEEAYFKQKAELEGQIKLSKASSLKRTFRTFSECLDYYCQSKAKYGNKNKGDSWEKGRKEKLRNDLGEFEIDDLTSAFDSILSVWRKEPTQKGTLPTESHTNRMIQLAKAATAYAYRFNHINCDPLRMFRVERELNARDNIINQEEFDRIYGCLTNWLKPIVSFAWYVPSRKGELAAIQRSEVNLDERVILLKSRTTKSKKGRTLPIPDVMMEYFRSIPADCPYAFYHKIKGVYHRIGDFHKSWKTACTKAGVTDLRFHDLRRCAATRLINSGVPESVVAKLGGWSSGFIMRKHYHFAGVDELHKAIGNHVTPIKMVPQVPLWCHSEGDNAEQGLRKAS